MYDAQRLYWLHQVPRQLTPDLEKKFEEVRSKPFFFVFWGEGVKGWRQDMANARLTHVAVVQANTALFNAEEATWAPAAFLWSRQPEAANPNWMAQWLANLGPRLYDGSAPQIAAQLNDPDSDIDVEVPQQLTGGAHFHLESRFIGPDCLPHGCIPESRVLPALVFPNTWELIPGSWYT